MKIACFGGWSCDCIDNTKCDCEEEILEPWNGKGRDLPSRNKEQKMIEISFEESANIRFYDFAVFPDDRELLSLGRYTYSLEVNKVYFRGYTGFFVYNPMIGFVECPSTEYTNNNRRENSLKCTSIKVS